MVEGVEVTFGLDVQVQLVLQRVWHAVSAECHLRAATPREPGPASEQRTPREGRREGGREEGIERTMDRRERDRMAKRGHDGQFCAMQRDV